jgi:hypothetical protein
MKTLLTHNFNPELSDKPLWLLDIDGVINAYSYKNRPNRKEKIFSEYTQYSVPSNHGMFYEFWVAQELTQKITEIHESKTVEIAWLTTWQSEANKNVASTLGLPTFPLAAQNNRLAYSPWKKEAALEALELNRPIIWSDDDEIDKECKSLFKADELEHLLVIPNPSLGLTPTHIEKIELFIEKNS